MNVEHKPIKLLKGEIVMFQKQNYEGTSEEKYVALSKQLNALLTGETDRIANLSNAAALLNQFLDEVNWVGFYLMKGEELVLGPFQGLPACVRIPKGKGVCGTVAEKQVTLRVQDVHQFPGHIACSSLSQSEIVVPVFKDGKVVAVLDVDSEELNTFDEIDQHYLEIICACISTYF